MKPMRTSPLLLLPLVAVVLPALLACPCEDSRPGLDPGTPVDVDSSRAVCGSDNTTYASECYLNCAKSATKGNK